MRAGSASPAAARRLTSPRSEARRVAKQAECPPAHLTAGTSMVPRLRGMLCLLACALTGCGPAAPADPQTLRFSALPDQPAADVIQQHKALVDRICALIHMSCQWVP